MAGFGNRWLLCDNRSVLDGSRHWRDSELFGNGCFAVSVPPALQWSVCCAAFCLCVLLRFWQFGSGPLSKIRPPLDTCFPVVEQHFALTGNLCLLPAPATSASSSLVSATTTEPAVSLCSSVLLLPIWSCRSACHRLEEGEPDWRLWGLSVPRPTCFLRGDSTYQPQSTPGQIPNPNTIKQAVAYGRCMSIQTFAW